MSIEQNDRGYGSLLRRLRVDLQLSGATDLQAGSVGPDSLAEVPYGVLSSVADQSISGPAIPTALAWDAPTAINLRGGMIASSAGLALPRDGLYLVQAFTWNSGGTFGGGAGLGFASQEITVNGAAINLGTAWVHVPNGVFIGDNSLTSVWAVAASAGEVLGVSYSQNLGSPMTVYGTATLPNQLMAVFLSNYG